MAPAASFDKTIGKGNVADQLALVSEDEKTQPVRRTCSLWVHDDNLSREDVLLDLAVFPKDAVRQGDLLEVAALAENPADEESAPSTVVSNVSNGAESTGPDKQGIPDTVAQDSAGDGQHTRRSRLREQGKRTSQRYSSYVFLVKELSPELKQKYPNLQVSRPTLCHD